MADWFAQNAPAAGGDWFAQNTPGAAKPVESADHDPGFWTVMGDAVKHGPTAFMDFVTGHPMQQMSEHGKAMGDAAKEAWKSGDKSTAVGLALASMIPGSGDEAVAAGDEFGAGHTGAGSAHAVLALAPFLAPALGKTVGPKVMDAAGTASTAAKGAVEGFTEGLAKAPPSTAGAAVGGAVGTYVGHKTAGIPGGIAGGATGAAVGSKVTAVPAAFRAALDKAALRVRQASQPLRPEPAWKSAPTPEPAPAPDVTPIPGQLPSGRKVGTGEAKAQPPAPAKSTAPQEVVSLDDVALGQTAKNGKGGRKFDQLAPAEKENVLAVHAALNGKPAPSNPLQSALSRNQEVVSSNKAKLNGKPSASELAQQLKTAMEESGTIPPAEVPVVPPAEPAPAASKPAAEPAPAKAAVPANPERSELNRALHAIANKKGLSHDELSDVAGLSHGVKSMKDLSVNQMKLIYKDLTGQDWGDPSAQFRVNGDKK